MINRIRNKVNRVISNIRHKRIINKYNNITRPNIHNRFESNLKSDTPKDGFLTKFSDVTRDIEIKEEDFELQEVILTCYFTKRKDPQSGLLRSIPEYKYIQPWYESVLKLDIYGIIVHDGIDPEFIQKYETDKIRFREYTAGNYAIYDERWIFYYLILKRTNIKRAFCTDLSDVYISSSPFDRHTNEKTLYIGRDNANKIRLSQWILDEINIYKRDANINIPKSFYHQSLYNVGIVGGEREILLFYLSKIIDYTQLTETERFKEMTVFNLVIHKYFGPKLVYNLNDSTYVDPSNDKESNNYNLITGYPLNSLFKGFEFDSDATFIHK